MDPWGMPCTYLCVPLKKTRSGDIGRNALLPCTTKRMKTTNLKTKNNQNFYKIKLSGSSSTMDLKKRHSPRLVRGVEVRSRFSCGRQRWRGPTSRQQLVDWGRWGCYRQMGFPTFGVDKPGGTTGEQDKSCNPGFQRGKRKPQNLWL